jgi:hypothetical protein
VVKKKLETLKGEKKIDLAKEGTTKNWFKV